MWEFKNGNYNQYRQEIESTDWEFCFNHDDINTNCKYFTDTILAIAKRHIPNKLVTVRPKDQPWYNGYLRRLRRNKERAFKTYKQNKSKESREHFKDTSKNYFSEINRIKQEYDEKKHSDLAVNTNRNSKIWWSLLKEVTYGNNNLRDSIPPIQHNGEFITSDKTKADVFNAHFLSMSTIDDSNTAPIINRRITLDNDLCDINISEQEVHDQLVSLDICKSYGPDGIPPKLLKEGGRPLSKILCKLFSLSLLKCQFPLNWKQANVTPVHKKNNKNDISNYRPISLLCTTSKVFEKIIFKHIYNHLKDNYVLTDFQSGFLPGRSTTTQLIDVYHTLCQSIDNEKEVRVVFLDIKKAFDRVWHKGLICKLHQAGISGNLLSWLESYLKNRQQRVVINGQSSQWGDIPAGVPQGSVLGPLLFLLYINDIVHEIQNCNIRLFADDTCLFIEVNNRDEAANYINEDLERIQRWSKKWLVSFSPEKTKSLIVSHKNDRHLNPPITFNNTVVSEVNSHTYLGLKFSYNLKWNEHIEHISTKAAQRLNMMLPLKYKIDRKTLETIYTTLVRPVMEYSIVVWGGTYDTSLAKLEQINVNAMRIITGATSNSNVAKLYLETSLNSIADRRDVAILTMFYKIKHGLAPNYLQELIPPERNQIVHYALRHNNNIEPPFARLETLKRSFILYAIRLWNMLPIDTRNINQIKEFKRSISKSENKNILYYYGKRWSNIHHSRLRIGCSGLNYDLYTNVHVINSPKCSCGADNETSYHFFMSCPNFTHQRDTLRTSIIHLCEFEYNTLLFGNNNLSNDENYVILDAVHKFIVDTRRFY
jgi:hypothetical protein